MKGELKLLREIADYVTGLIFCRNDSEQDFCEEMLCRRLTKLGYVEIKDDNYIPTGKSEVLKDFGREFE